MNPNHLPMTAVQKRRLIRQLINGVRDDIIATVPKMPPEWDGIELRELIADKFAGQTHLSSKVYWGDNHGERAADKRRLWEYRNEKLCRNL